jgi:hypothetical protein
MIRLCVAAKHQRRLALGPPGQVQGATSSVDLPSRQLFFNKSQPHTIVLRHIFHNAFSTCEDTEYLWVLHHSCIIRRCLCRTFRTHYTTDAISRTSTTKCADVRRNCRVTSTQKLIQKQSERSSTLLQHQARRICSHTLQPRHGCALDIEVMILKKLISA